MRTPGFTQVGPTRARRDDDCDGSALAHTNGDLALHSVDLCGGTIAQIGPTGAGNACGIVQGPGGLLWGTGTYSGQRVQLDPSMGISEDVAGVEHELGNCDMA
jgi:hypothetical protein